MLAVMLLFVTMGLREATNLTLNTVAYTTEIFAGAIRATLGELGLPVPAPHDAPH